VFRVVLRCTEVLKIIEEVCHQCNIIYTPRTRASRKALAESGPAPAVMVERTKVKHT
jgi:hypothetical protein